MLTRIYVELINTQPCRSDVCVCVCACVCLLCRMPSIFQECIYMLASLYISLLNF